MTPVRAALALLVLPAAVGLTGPASAEAPPPCGTVVTTSVAYSGSMSCPVGDALVVGADGITLDLRRLTITGSGPYATSGAGVRVARHDGVTVLGGTVRDMNVGVLLDQASHNRVSKVVVVGADRGLQTANGAHNTFDKNRVSGGGRDAILVDGPGAVHNRVLQNEVVGNVFGIFVTNLAADNLVTQNVVRGTRESGIATYAGTSRTTVSRNTVSGGGADGVQVGADAADVTVSQNVLSDNAGDGLQSDRPGTVVAKNAATSNGQLGILAPGAVDGGGNTASGNGDPRQCVGVVCTAS